MEKEFVPYNMAVKLKELGFDEPCLASWSYTYELQQHIEFKLGYIIDGPRNYTNAPTYSQAFRWFREKYQLIGYPYPNEYQKYGYRLIEVKVPENEELFYDWGTKDTYEEAELACLDRLIEIVESKSE